MAESKSPNMNENNAIDTNLQSDDGMSQVEADLLLRMRKLKISLLTQKKNQKFDLLTQNTKELALLIKEIAEMKIINNNDQGN